MFDLNADWMDIARTLRSDPALAKRLTAAPGLRVPGCWNGFELAMRAILGQQITVKGATTLAGRIVRMFGQAVRPVTWTHTSVSDGGGSRRCRSHPRRTDAGAGSDHPRTGASGLRQADQLRRDHGSRGVSGEAVRDSRHRDMDGTIHCDARAGRTGCVSCRRYRACCGRWR